MKTDVRCSQCKRKLAVIEDNQIEIVRSGLVVNATIEKGRLTISCSLCHFTTVVDGYDGCLSLKEDSK